MLRWRLPLGALLIAALAALVWLDHRAAVAGVWLLPLVGVLAVLATDETLSLAAQAGLRPMRLAVFGGNLALVAGVWIAFRAGAGANGALALVVPLLGTAILALCVAEMARFRQPGGAIGNIAAGVFALVYVGGMFALLVHLRLAGGVAALVAFIVTVKMGDTGAYVVGRLLGRHKLAPTVSPGKTVEGAVGHLAGACLGAWASSVWLTPLFASPPQATGLLPCPWLWFGLLVGVAGMLADLAESLIKRDVGAKDSSAWMPGFGGVLDILDSLLLAAPVGWLCWRAAML